MNKGEVFPGGLIYRMEKGAKYSERGPHMGFPLMERGILNIKECALFNKFPSGGCGSKILAFQEQSETQFHIGK